jgi:iron complex transport system substrate-binding protein
VRRHWVKALFLVTSVMVATVPTGSSAIASAARPVHTTGTSAAPLTARRLSVGQTGGTESAQVVARPSRILSLSASATQMLYAIGAGGQVVGVDKYSTYPPDAPRTKFTGYESSAEDYLYLRPDLVIFAFQTNLVKQLKALGIPSLVLPPATSLADAYSQISELGTVTGHAAEANRVQGSLATDVRTTVRSAQGAGRGETYYIEVDPTYYTATSATFIGAEFSLFGMRDIADAAGHGGPYPQIQAEYLLKENPDYVFLADTVCCQQTAATFAHRPGFSILRAVKLHHWGPHTIEEFVSLLARTLRA